MHVDYSEFVSLLPDELKEFPAVLKSDAVVTLACCGLGLCSLRKGLGEGATLMQREYKKLNVRFINFRPLTR